MCNHDDPTILPEEPPANFSAGFQLFIYERCLVPSVHQYSLVDQHFFGDADEFVSLQESAISTLDTTTASVTAGKNAFNHLLRLSIGVLQERAITTI